MTDESSEPRENKLLSDPDTLDNLRMLYPVLNANRIDWTARKWDTLRLATMFGSAVALAVAGLALREQDPTVRIVLGIGVAIVGILIGIWARKNISRESAHQYRDLFAMWQVEKLLGFHREIPEHQRIRREIEFLFPSWRRAGGESTGDSLERWVGGMVAQKGSFMARTVADFTALLTIVLVLLGLAIVWLGTRALNT